MKLQLDTTSKTVRVEGTVNLEALYETLQKLLPNGEWKQFSIESNSTITWVNPITIPYYPYYPTTPYPWWEVKPWGTICDNGANGIGFTPNGTYSTNYTITEGVFNIEI
jgi:hypothetical protein